MEVRENDLQSRLADFFVNADRNTSAIVLYRNRTIFVQFHNDGIAKSC
jgi:hypothetical protein